MIRKILSPSDLSANSKTGVAYAISLVRENRAELIIFHAASISFPLLACPCEVDPLFGRNCVPRFTVDQLMREGESKLIHFIHAHLGDEFRGLRWKPKISLGKPAKEIVTAACQEEADLIVMAKKKKRPLSRLLSRSISEAVSRQAYCPVVSVSPPQTQRLWRGWRVPLIGGVVQGSEA